MNMKEAVKSLSNTCQKLLAGKTIPTENGYWIINVEFINSRNCPDETQFDILSSHFDYGKGECRELEELLKGFCKENNFRQNSITNLYFDAIGQEVSAW